MMVTCIALAQTPKRNEHRYNNRRAAVAPRDHGWQLFRRELSALRVLEAGIRVRVPKCARTFALNSQLSTLNSARPLHAYSLLPQALPLLLLQSLYRQRFRRSARLPRCAAQGTDGLRRQTRRGRAQGEVHLLRRRHAQLSFAG